MTMHVSNPWWGWSICFKKWDLQAPLRWESVEAGGEGRGGGEDTAAGTMDYKTMLEPAVGL